MERLERSKEIIHKSNAWLPHSNNSNSNNSNICNNNKRCRLALLMCAYMLMSCNQTYELNLNAHTPSVSSLSALC